MRYDIKKTRKESDSEMGDQAQSEIGDKEYKGKQSEREKENTEWSWRVMDRRLTVVYRVGTTSYRQENENGTESFELESIYILLEIPDLPSL